MVQNLTGKEKKFISISSFMEIFERGTPEQADYQKSTMDR